MVIRSVRRAAGIGLFVAAWIVCCPIAAQAAGTKVVVTPNTPTVSEGSSQTFTVQLNQPIIVSDMSRNYVHLNVTSSDPSRISVTPNPVEYLPTEWWQQKSFTVTALTNATYGDSANVTITITADSGAAYYDLYTVSVPLAITDATPAPAPSPVAPSTQVASITTPETQLTNTGVELTVTSVAATTLVASALFVHALPTKRRHV